MNIHIYSCKRFLGPMSPEKMKIRLDTQGHKVRPAGGGGLWRRGGKRRTFFFFVGYWSVTCQHSTTHIRNKGRKKRHRCCWTLLSFLSPKSLGPSITIASWSHHSTTLVHLRETHTKKKFLFFLSIKRKRTFQISNQLHHILFHSPLLFSFHDGFYLFFFLLYIKFFCCCWIFIWWISSIAIVSCGHKETKFDY